MWYKITATWESGKTYHYEVKGMAEAMKRVARLKATNEVVYCEDHLISCKIEKVEE